MKVSAFFSPRMVLVLELFFTHKKMMLSTRDVLQLLDLDHSANRADIDKIHFSFYKMDILTRVRTSRKELGNDLGILKLTSFKKFYYGLNLKNPQCKSLEELFIKIKKSRNYRPDSRYNKKLK